MRKPALLVALCAVIVVAAAGCSTGPIEPTTIVEAVHTQQQAIDGFDSSEQTETDLARLAELADVLAEHGLSGDVTILGNCEGGRTTRIEYSTAEVTRHIEVDTCGDDEAADAIDELISSWR